ncbi:hypothetical protein [Leptospira alstonii]|uniref:Uncharacterized protein n=1 Tax=Leptospira alstonii serovar Sichuan str. 79601 TaxID=1218565 RepID=M6D2I9_9LEPT|nr:hypothetical protein [Leptospira alstonii]AGS80536.1 hypothetical protein LEP1GSC193_0776 [Leptospira phage vB_LalZ_80412-LE1]EMJ95398.1 hypothetical protein LEP1GSC194_3576 [Leptospira alstonii serovar Sichuan str. 79601]
MDVLPKLEKLLTKPKSETAIKQEELERYNAKVCEATRWLEYIEAAANNGFT